MTPDDGDPMTPEESIRRARENARFVELANIYDYCYNNLEDFESGELEPSDLPHVGSKENDVFSEFTGAIILRSISFGCCWEYHVPADRDSGGESSSPDANHNSGGEPPTPERECMENSTEFSQPEPDAWIIHYPGKYSRATVPEVFKGTTFTEEAEIEKAFAASTIQKAIEQEQGKFAMGSDAWTALEMVARKVGTSRKEVFDPE